VVGVVLHIQRDALRAVDAAHEGRHVGALRDEVLRTPENPFWIWFSGPFSEIVFIEVFRGFERSHRACTHPLLAWPTEASPSCMRCMGGQDSLPRKRAGPARSAGTGDGSSAWAQQGRLTQERTPQPRLWVLNTSSLQRSPCAAKAPAQRNPSALHASHALTLPKSHAYSALHYKHAKHKRVTPPVCGGTEETGEEGTHLLRERVGAVQAELAAGPGAALEHHCAALVQHHVASCARMHT
jgi:hypothetical protein